MLHYPNNMYYNTYKAHKHEYLMLFASINYTDVCFICELRTNIYIQWVCIHMLNLCIIGGGFSQNERHLWWLKKVKMKVING